MRVRCFTCHGQVYRVQAALHFFLSMEAQLLSMIEALKTPRVDASLRQIRLRTSVQDIVYIYIYS